MELNKEQIDFLNEFTSGTWTINTGTGLVDIDGDFDFSREGCSFIPREGGLKDLKGVRFGVVTGHFKCKYNSLTSLMGAPQNVGGDFSCSGNKLTSLVGSPQEVGGYFDCSNNNLTSLVGAPKKVGWNFWCSYNKLTSLEGAPQKVRGDFHCQGNKLKSLVGAPQVVKGSFHCYVNRITSLEGAPKEIRESLYCSHNPISQKTLKLVWKTMQKSKVDYVGALLILNKKIPNGYCDKMIRGYEDRITPEAIKTYSIVSRYSL